jgi:hypothetical protein
LASVHGAGCTARTPESTVAHDEWSWKEMDVSDCVNRSKQSIYELLPATLKSDLYPDTKQKRPARRQAVELFGCGGLH